MKPVAGWQLRMQRTRRTIAAVALDLFERNGFDDVTMADIAAHAEVGQRTVYRYYPTKIDIVLSSDEPDELAQFVEALRAAPPELSITDAVFHAITTSVPDAEVVAQDRVRIGLIRRTPTLWQAWLAALESIEPDIRDWLASRTGLSEESPEVRVAAVALLGAHRVVVDGWDGSDYDSYLSFVRRALDVLEAGLGGLGGLGDAR